MKKLIIIEGADNLGKTTLIRELSERLGPENVKLIVQPNGTGPLGFLRETVKYDPKLGPFERQLLHTISHINDAYTEFNDRHEYFIMDRSYLSALVYGHVSGMDPKNLELLWEIHRSVYEGIFSQLEIKPFIYVITGSKPFAGPDDSVYEQLSWKAINELYVDLAEHYPDVVSNQDLSYFSKDEDIFLLDRANTKFNIADIIIETLSESFKVQPVEEATHEQV